MIEELPDRPLEDEEIDSLKNKCSILECVYKRNGCISFIIGIEDEGYLGFQYDVFDVEWYETFSTDDYDIPLHVVIAKHKNTVKTLIEEVYQADINNGYEFDYMMDM